MSPCHDTSSFLTRPGYPDITPGWGGAWLAIGPAQKDIVPAEGVLDIRIPDIRIPDFSDPGYSDPGYSDPGYSNPGYSDPGYNRIPDIRIPEFELPMWDVLANPIPKRDCSETVFPKGA